jgi:hypothetical protein
VLTRFWLGFAVFIGPTVLIGFSSLPDGQMPKTARA